MIGAIIGDLAAWTWENDKGSFYPKLVSPKACPSEISLALIALSHFSPKDISRIRWEEIKGCLKDIFRKSDVCLTCDWANFLDDDKTIPFRVKQELIMAAVVACGLESDSEETARKWKDRFHGGRAEHYLCKLPDIIYRLYHGAIKEEFFNEKMLFRVARPLVNLCVNDISKEDISSLSYVCLAWKCFEDSWDFTSAIHNAIRYKVKDRHILAFLAGAIAEAMYGCDYVLLKRKYTKDSNYCKPIDLPADFSQNFAEEISHMKFLEKESRTFYPKNNALTNVERHHWTKVDSLFSKMAFTETDYRRVLQSAPINKERRFGLYLDDGWMYVYCSRYILGRFQFIKGSSD